MTNQQAFNKVTKYLLKQKRRSLLNDGGFMCAYRGNNGLKCAIGCLISDSEYKPNMEHKTLRQIIYQIPSLKGLNKKLLTSLQNLHDCTSPHKWRLGLIDVANVYGLKKPKELK